MKIITLTLNPAIDVHCYTQNFRPYKENQCVVTEREAGGKGVNISRALTFNGVENSAFVVLGAENGESFRKSLEADGLTLKTVTLPGAIRENITLHCDNADETRISFAGFTADDTLLDTAFAALEGETDGNTLVTFTGSNPKGLSMAKTKEFLRALQGKGAKIVIDSRSFSLEDLVEMKPWLIKPNQEEISAYLGREIETLEEVCAAARDLHEKGIENVMISMGPKGALLVCDEGVFFGNTPDIPVLSTIGAGDSSVAGFVSVADSPAQVRLHTAVTFGTAACLTSGTKPPLPQDVEAISAQVSVEKV